MPICSLYVEFISLRLQNQLTNDWVKVSLRESVQIRSFFLSECRKIWARKTPYLDTFHAVYMFGCLIQRKDNSDCNNREKKDNKGQYDFEGTLVENLRESLT